MANTNEVKVTLRDVLNAVVASNMDEDIKARAAQELDALDRKAARAKEKRAEKSADNSAKYAEIREKVLDLIQDGEKSLEDIAAALELSKQKLTAALKDFDEVVKVEIKGKTASGKTAKRVGYKVA